MPDPNQRRAREDIAPEHGRRMIVQCDRPECGHAVLMDPRPLFGSNRSWPVAGGSNRFRCQCGSRVANVSYTRNSAQNEGPIPPAALALWF
jgi:hypothetical protein